MSSDFMERWNALSDEDQAAIVAQYDEMQRQRVRQEWEAEGSYEHPCESWDTYCGGCSTCGAVIEEGDEE